MSTHRRRPPSGRSGEAPDAHVSPSPDPSPDAVEIAADDLRAAIDQAADSITIADARGRIIYANFAAERHVGRPRAEIIGRHFLIASAPSQDESQHEAISKAVGEGRSWSGTYVAVSTNGSTVASDLIVSPVHDPTGRVTNVVAIGRDVSRERSLESDLAREVQLRAGIVSTISRLEASESIEDQANDLADALMQIGDVSLARVIALGPGDLWYRIASRGHEEIDVSSTRPPSAFLKSIRRRARNGPWVVSIRRWPARDRAHDLEAAGISALALAPIRHRGALVGLLVAGSDRDGASGLERHLSMMAELAEVASAMLGPGFAARAQAADVRATIERVTRDAAFRPVYQPIVQLRDGKILAYEALTRFDDGTPPDIRFAEAAAIGWGIDLEIATLDAALKSASQFPADACLTVNVSPALINERLQLQDLLASHRGERRIVLEITERLPIDDYEGLRYAISQVATDVRWAIDDAGAGYASLRHILELRPQFVKLDRALIANVGLDPARQALVAGLLHFSDALGTTLVAEGIETSAERLALEQLGLTMGQGYLFGRPQEAKALVASRRARSTPIRRRERRASP